MKTVEQIMGIAGTYAYLSETQDANGRAFDEAEVALRTAIEELAADAEKWRKDKARKDAVIAAGMGKKAMRDSAAGAAPVPRMTGAALASQEPVAEVLLVDGEKVIDASMAFFDSVELGTKLYLAAGAAPAKEQTK